jgi:hypothetical protein
MEGFTHNLILRTLMKTRPEAPNLIKIGDEIAALYMKT